MASTIPIAVERLLEKEVQEIARDGQETYAPQLSMSEKLAQLAHKIDFSKTSEEDEDLSNDCIQEEKPIFQPSLWPWDSVRNKLRNTLTNLSVLTDVLSVAGEKKYLSLDPVSQGEAPPKATVRLLTKRKNFNEASKILLQGAQDMSGGQQEVQNLNTKDFHTELMHLRQRWRLKRSGNLIIGDLSYKSAGSKFWHNGAFEVKKQQVSEDENLDCIDVNISSDLNGFSNLLVNITSDDQNSGVNVTDRLGFPPIPATVDVLHRKLYISQNNLFCKELFAQLAHESYHGKGIATQVVGNTIEVKIFPKTKMTITFVHETEEESGMCVDERMVLTDVLDFSLQTLLRQQHRSSCSYETPRPVTSGVAMKENKKQRIAGPTCMIAQDLESLNKSRRLLDKLVNIVKHHILAKNVCHIVYQLAEEICDPIISCHWSSLSTETSSFATIYIGLENRIERTSIAMKVTTDTIHITPQNGIGLTLSAETQELKTVLRNQVQLFIVEISRKIGLRLGWIVKHNNFLRNVCEGEGSEEFVMGVLLSSPAKERDVLVEIAPPSLISIKVKSPQYNDPLPEILENEPKWAAICRNYHHLNYDKIPGRTLWEKLSIVLQAS